MFPLLLLISGVAVRQQQADAAATHHVFVFRHCVRSTSQNVNLYDANTKDATAFPTKISAYLNASLPDWKVGGKRCTQMGIQHMKAVGTHLMQTYFRDATALEVEFISDTSHRDLTTSRALAEGLELGREPDQVIHGLQDVKVDPNIFYPTKRREGSQDSSPLCDAPDHDQLTLDINNRLNTTPQPSETVHNAINFIQRDGGVGSIGRPLATAWEHRSSVLASSSPILNPALHALTGPINVVNHVAEMAFYSKASNISTFMLSWTMNETMGLLAWHYWRRSVLMVHNTQSAMRGVVLMHRVLQALQQPHDNQEHAEQQEDAATTMRGEDVQNNHHRATFIVGHDGNLDALATILNASWELPSPYPSSRRDVASTDNLWFATPPGSAFYFERSSRRSDTSQGEDIKVSMLAPMLLQHNNGDDGDATALVVANISGILESVPVSFHSNPEQGTALEDAGTTVTKLADSTQITGCNPIAALRNRVVEIATRAYPQSLTCYKAALSHYPTDETIRKPANNSLCGRDSSGVADDAGEQSGGTASAAIGVVAILMGGLVLVFGCVLALCQRQTTKSRQGTIPVPSADIENNQHDFDLRLC